VKNGNLEINVNM